MSKVLTLVRRHVGGIRRAVLLFGSTAYALATAWPGTTPKKIQGDLVLTRWAPPLGRRKTERAVVSGHACVAATTGVGSAGRGRKQGDGHPGPRRLRVLEGGRMIWRV
jgi:hypothetical protein